MSVQVEVRSALSGEDVCKVSLILDQSVRDLKHVIAKDCGIPFYEQMLHNDECKLYDDMCIRELTLSPKLAIILFRRDPARAAALNHVADGGSLGCLNEKHRGDPEIVAAAVQYDPVAAMREHPFQLQHASDELRGDRDFILGLFSKRRSCSFWMVGDVWPHIAEHLRSDREIVMTMLMLTKHSCGVWDWVIASVSASLLHDRSFLLSIAPHDDAVLKYAPAYLKSNASFVLEVLKCNTYVLRHVPEVLWQNVDFLSGALELDAFAFDYVPANLWQDRSFVLNAVRIDGNGLGRAVAFKSDKEVAMAAVSCKREALRFVAPKLRHSCNHMQSRFPEH